MKLHVTVWNKPEVLTAFLLDAFKAAELYGGRLSVHYGGPVQSPLEGSDFFLLQAGEMADLEIGAQGEEAGKILEAVRRLMRWRYGDSFYFQN